MVSKQEILDSLAEYDAKELAGFILQGVVSLEELVGERELFPRRMEREVVAVLQSEQRALYREAMEGGEQECKCYLQIFPKSEDAPKVRARLDKVRVEERDRREHAAMYEAWERVRSLDTIADYESFIRDYPSSQLVQEARGRIVELYDVEAEQAWQSLRGSRDVRALSEFIKRYPNSSFVAAAKKRRDELVDDRLHGGALERLLCYLRDPFNKVYAEQQIKDEINSGKVDRRELLFELRDEINLLSSQTMLGLIRSGIYSYSDLLDVGFEQDLVAILKEGRVGKIFRRGAIWRVCGVPTQRCFSGGYPLLVRPARWVRC